MSDKVSVLEDLSVFEVSMVTDPANPDAHVTLFKSAEEEDVVKGKFNEVLDAVELEEQVREMMRPMWDYSEALQLSFRSVLVDESVTDKIAALKGCVGEFANRLKKEISAIELSTKKSAEEEHGGKSHKEDVDMSGNKDVKTFDQPAVDKMVSEAVEKARKDDGVEELKVLAEMGDAEKAYLKGLESQPQADFLKMDSDTRKSLIEKAASDDEILKTSAGDIRKSEVGDKAFALLKISQAQVEEAQKVANEERDIRLTKENITKAEAAWPNLVGDLEAKGQVMKALLELPEAVQKTLTAMLDQAETKVVELFKVCGTTESSDSTDVPESKLDALAKARAEEKDETYGVAYQKVLKSAEGRELYIASKDAKVKTG